LASCAGNYLPLTKAFPRIKNRNGSSADFEIPILGETAISNGTSSSGGHTVIGPRVTSAPL
jgi:hypothetical protein